MGSPKSPSVDRCCGFLVLKPTADTIHDVRVHGARACHELLRVPVGHAPPRSHAWAEGLRRGAGGAHGGRQGGEREECTGPSLIRIQRSSIRTRVQRAIRYVARAPDRRYGAPQNQGQEAWHRDFARAFKKVTATGTGSPARPLCERESKT